MVRTVLAVIAGALAGMFVIMTMESVSGLLFPTPPGVDLSKAGATATYIANVPIGALLFILLGWAAGSYVAGAIATRISRRASLLPGLAAGAVLLFSGVLGWFLAPLISLSLSGVAAVFGIPEDGLYQLLRFLRLVGTG